VHSGSAQTTYKYILYRFVQDYNDHILEISNKLVAIMDSMLEINISKVGFISHLCVSDTASLTVTAYFVTT